MSMADFGGLERQRPHDTSERPQPEFRVSMTLAITDATALWSAAAASLLRVPEMTLGDVLDLIGPREDPNIADCITTIAKPAALAGCLIDDFWIDGLNGSPPRTEMASALLGHKLASAGVPRRAPRPRQPGPRLALCHIPPPHEDAPTIL